MSVLTGNRDADLLILQKLTDYELTQVCQVNKKVKTLCEDENFWRNRFNMKFGNLLIKYKPQDITWKNYYLTLTSQDITKEYLDNFKGLIIIWEKKNPKLIEFCDNISNNNIYVSSKLINNDNNSIFVIESDMRNEITSKHPSYPNYPDSCPICKQKLSEKCLECLTLGKCFLTPEKGNSIAYVQCPIVRGECNHIYHNHCINSWRKKKDVCPLDNHKWNVVIMDSFVTGRWENKPQIIPKEEALRNEYEKRKKEYISSFDVNIPAYRIPPYDSFEYFLYQLNPESESSLNMKREYERRKASYIASFHEQYPNSPADPVYPPFNLFNYNAIQFPLQFREQL